MNGKRDGHENDFWRKLWSLKMPGKILNFLWRACHNVLPTLALLARKNVEVNAICSWCRLHSEEATYRLFKCSFARSLWEKIVVQELANIDDEL